MISRELEVSLHACFVDARKKRHEFVTVEHLLLCLLDNPSAKATLLACSENIDSVEVLRKSLEDFIKNNTPTVVENGIEVDTQPTLGFQRCVQRAIMWIKDIKKEVSGAEVLLAIFGERDSHAVSFLHEQNIIRLDVVSYISHGIRKDGKLENDLQSMSVFQFFMKLKDGEVDPRYVKLVKKFKALINKEGGGFGSTQKMTFPDFLSSDKVALSSSVEKSKVTLRKK